MHRKTPCFNFNWILFLISDGPHSKRAKPLKLVKTSDRDNSAFSKSWGESEI
jgi:hypothetical protein